MERQSVPWASVSEPWDRLQNSSAQVLLLVTRWRAKPVIWAGRRPPAPAAFLVYCLQSVS